jgi:ADP-ribosylation factor-like protein 3
MRRNAYWQVSEAMGLINIRDRVWHLQPCSAKTGEGLQKGMEWLVSNVSKT